MRFEREPGFWLGGYVINFGTGELGILALFAVLIDAEANGTRINAWPFIVVGVALAVVGPALTFPFSRTVWSAVDLIMRPLSEEETLAAQAAVAAAAIDLDPPSSRGSPGPGPVGR